MNLSNQELDFVLSLLNGIIKYMTNKKIDKKIVIYQAKSGAIEFRGDFIRETI
jgi:hypothetical protein